jgi:DNA-binding transcriptional LysR family regulator
MLELRLLRYFIAVAETEHVGRAAARLHISQSPLSRQIRQLEELLGVTLFERDRRRIRLTETGRWLLRPAREMIARAEALTREAQDLSHGDVGQISIGFVSAALASGVLPAALRRLGRERPRVRIALRQLASGAQLAELRAGTLDVALIHRRAVTAELEEHRLSDQPYVLAVPRPGRLVRGPIRAAQLDGQPWIAVGPGDAVDRWAAAIASAGFLPQVVVQVVEWASALALVDAGVGLALVPASYAAGAPPNVAIRPLPWLRLTSGLSLVRRRSHRSPLIDVVSRWIFDAAHALRPMVRRARRAPRVRGSRGA